MDKDQDIKERVEEELSFDPRIDAAGIGVGVSDGVVTLSGYVKTYSQKIAAEAAVKRVKGVNAVAVDIEVRLPTDVRWDDTKIAERVTSILAWSVEAPKEGVKVRVDNGWVYLEGSVGWAYQRQEAERLVRTITGVRGVVNGVKVRPHVEPKDVKDQLKKAFHRNAELEAAGITVGVTGGKVILTGKVRTWSDRQEAERAAWAVPGVSEVVDHLTL